jgi:hypothetical protein
MVKIGGGASTPEGTQGAARLDYGGTGKREKPYTFFFCQLAENFNAATISLNLFGDLKDIVVRIRKVHITYDGTTATALNIASKMALAVHSYAAGGAGTDQVIVLCPQQTFAAAAAPWQDGYTWDFGPDGIEFIKATGTNFNGYWDGMVTVQHSGYAATDDAYVIIEGEWEDLS